MTAKATIIIITDSHGLLILTFSFLSCRRSSENIGIPPLDRFWYLLTNLQLEGSVDLILLPVRLSNGSLVGAL